MQRRPVVIAILSWNRRKLLRDCLEAIARHTDYPHTLCVVEQGSTDGSREYLQGLGDRVVPILLDENVGFVRGNNLVMDRFREQDVVLLNNDTLVRPGWLTALADRAYSAPEVGIVGAKLVYPDGRLQEAGGEIFQDGTGRNIGKRDDPDRYSYTQVREVDYCSAACLYVRREVLERVGFLDERYHPAYFEDTDLCFAAAAAGFRVLYEPAAVVVHLEGGTAGRGAEQSSLSRELQERNRPKFLEKWAVQLRTKRTGMYDHRPRNGKPQLLMILPFMPLYDKAAGELKWFRTLPLLQERYDVVLLARNAQQQRKYIDAVEAMGVTVYATDQTRLEAMGISAEAPFRLDFEALLRANDFQAVLIGFWHVAHQYLEEIRRHAPRAMVVIDSVDLEYVRLERKGALTGSEAERWKSEWVRRAELEMYRRADLVLTVTEQDRRTLQAEIPGLATGISADIHPLLEPCEESDGLLFVGNFGHDPNEDAVRWFCREVFPRIRPQLPGVRLSVVGNAPTPAVLALAGPDVTVTGYVPEVDPYYQAARVGVFPIRYGAGMKGKVAKGLLAGLPMVLTSVCAEGMELVHEESALIADTAETFAEAVVRLYRDEALRARVRRGAQRTGERLYGLATVRRHWEATFALLAAGRPTPPAPAPAAPPPPARPAYRKLARRPALVPSLGIVIPVHNCLAHTQQCVETIRRYTELPHEILVVDNGSSDGTADWCWREHLHCVRLPENRGFAAACNAGIREALSEFVILLNNDTLVAPGWAERLLDHLEREPAAGLVGPSTSYASSAQQIPAEYTGLEEYLRFARRIAREHKGQTVEVDRLVGVCLAARRRLFEEIGLFDERFGLGNYEDDDLCLRVRMAGYRLLWARDVYIHHIGSQTFASVQVDYQGLLEKNREIFRQKWDVRGQASERLRHLLAAPLATTPAAASLPDSPPAGPDPERLAALAAAGRAGSWGAILGELERLGTRHPAAAAVQALWGQALWRAGRRAEAEARLRRAVALTPEAVEARTLLAELYMAAGRAGEALAELEAVRRLRPQDDEVAELVRALRDRMSVPAGAGAEVGRG
jgi:O-antigen biosynthesis protein